MPDIYYSSHFERSFRKLPKLLQEAALKKEALFRHNPFDPLLQTHKLKGKLQELWSFSISREHRIIFEFEKDATVIFIDVGDHSVYR